MGRPRRAGGMISIALLGDVRLNREGLAALLSRDGRLAVAATSATAHGLPAAAASVDVIVVDTAADAKSQSIRDVVDNAPAPAPVVALGAPDDEQGVIGFAELGVMGFVEREAELDELVASIVSAAQGEASFPPRIATTLLHRISSLGTRRPSAESASLTAREREIVQLIAQGLSNKEIGTRLFIEVATVKNHVHNILEKLQVSRRGDAVARLRLVEGDASAPARVTSRAARSTTRSTAG
jgi:two-component system, NarL family, nitrate/nitrite response regulator NarL